MTIVVARPGPDGIGPQSLPFNSHVPAASAAKTPWATSTAASTSSARPSSQAALNSPETLHKREVPATSEAPPKRGLTTWCDGGGGGI